jgi:cyclophilin family peptidyl-prolyl cis-trans isomerase
VFETSLGTFEVELFEKEAPVSSKNFLEYVDDGFFDGVIFHRVIPGFMIQGGGFEPGMKQKKVKAPIKNEATNGLKNSRGTLAMARTNDINSATAQFFVNLVDNDFLDHSGPATTATRCSARSPPAWTSSTRSPRSPPRIAWATRTCPPRT